VVFYTEVFTDTFTTTKSLHDVKHELSFEMQQLHAGQEVVPQQDHVLFPTSAWIDNNKIIQPTFNRL